MQLWDVPSEKLKAPDVSVQDFEKVLRHAFASVSEDELEEYTKWTKQFGQEGA
jgi:vacuolar protein-sorting-associated protein 4